MTDVATTQANEWAGPEGYEGRPPSIRYLIRQHDEGDVVERRTAVAFDTLRRRYYHSLADEDQHFADALVDLIQGACAYFHASDESYVPLDGVPDVVISDDDVRRRIERLERGENVREAERTAKQYYPLTELPFDQQRALVEQIEALKQSWQFAIIGEESGPAPGSPEATPSAWSR